jgi:hypothetical protein
MPPSRSKRNRPPPLKLQGEFQPIDLGQVPQQKDIYRAQSPMSATVEAPGSPDSVESVPTDIRFRTAETPTKSLHSASSVAADAMQAVVNRRPSLVKVEDYMPPPSGRPSSDWFNPYQSPVRSCPS